jgi:putative membrane protein
MFPLKILFWVFLILCALYLMRRFRERISGGQVERPLDILKRRYARGEITRQEYERTKKDLRG